MAIFDVIKYRGGDKEFAWRYPSDKINIGSQLIVNTAQTAFLVKGGVIYDQYAPGTYTLNTHNIPILNKFLNVPFGNQTPFTAEIWFINLITKLDYKWGTLSPIQLEDPKYGVIVPVRAYGQYGLKISRPRIFLETLVSNMDSYSAEKILQYFKGKVIMALTSLISQKLVLDNISILEINAHLESMSLFCQGKLLESFKKYGIDIVNFSFMSINASEDDESVKKLKEAKDLAARIKIVGRDNYQMDKSFDVLGRAADNEGVASSFTGAGIGMGVGLGFGGQMSNMSSQVINTNPTTAPPTFRVDQYFVYINDRQEGPFNSSELKELIRSRQINRNTYVWKNGMSDWEVINNILELQSILDILPPPFTKKPEE